MGVGGKLQMGQLFSIKSFSLRTTQQREHLNFFKKITGSLCMFLKKRISKSCGGWPDHR